MGSRATRGSMGEGKGEEVESWELRAER